MHELKLIKSLLDDLVKKAKEEHISKIAKIHIRMEILPS